MRTRLQENGDDLKTVGKIDYSSDNFNIQDVHACLIRFSNHISRLTFTNNFSLSRFLVLFIFFILFFLLFNNIFIIILQAARGCT